MGQSLHSLADLACLFGSDAEAREERQERMTAEVLIAVARGSNKAAAHHAQQALVELAVDATLNDFGRDALARAQKTARAEATRREDFAMTAVPQSRPGAKPVSFGIGDPDQVTDLSKIIVPDVQEGAEKSAGYRYLQRVEMSVAQWATVQDNPRQRDTELHAKKAKHLRTYDPIHRFVSMARLPSGELFKLDGHTRSLIWSRGEVVAPGTVVVDVFACDTIQSVQELYSKIDSQSAVETGADKLNGAARQHGLQFESVMLKGGRYGTAVKRLYMLTAKNWTPWSDAQFIYDAVGFWVPELRLLDKVNPHRSAFTAGVTMAALATFKRRGTLASKFWTAYSQDKGTRDSQHMDGVQALREAVVNVKLKAAGRSLDGGYNQQASLLGKGILAFEAYRHNTLYKSGKGSGIRNMDDDVLREYLRRSVEG